MPFALAIAVVSGIIYLAIVLLPKTKCPLVYQRSKKIVLDERFSSRPIGYADLLGRLPKGVGQGASFGDRQSRRNEHQTTNDIFK
jgi:hypothetical protein